MGKSDSAHLREKAVAAHCAALPEQKSAREVAEEADEAEAVALDEMAAVLRGRGCPAKDAPGYVAAVVAYLQAKDKAAVREAVGSEPGGESVLARVEALESLRMMAIAQYQAPKPRLSAGCLILALGSDHPDFSSARGLAERQAVSPEHVSNGVGEWQRMLKLPPATGQKTAAQKAIYKKTNGRCGRTEL